MTMDRDDFDLCNEAHRALICALQRSLRGYALDYEIKALALAKLDFNGKPLDSNGTAKSMLPAHLLPLVKRRANVREWAPKAPPRPPAYIMLLG